MRATFRISLLTLAALVLLDVAVALGLSVAQQRGILSGLVDFLNLGRSVPGKIQNWQSQPLTATNPIGWGWIDERLDFSTDRAAARPAQDGALLHSYGMSFTRNVVHEAVQLDPTYAYVTLGGPVAPPNHTYTLIVQDRQNRRAGDVIVFGMLSTSLPAMESLGARSWNFELPYAYTYPIYRPHGDGLRVTAPLVATLADQLNLDTNSAQKTAWQAQLTTEDALYTPQAFQATWLDASPFARMLRRALATQAIEDRKSAFMAGPYPHSEVLTRMLADVQRMVQEDDQELVVLLSQAFNDSHVDLRAEIEPILAQLGINYVATQDYVNPRDPKNFVSDGHYATPKDQIFARQLLDRLTKP